MEALSSALSEMARTMAHGTLASDSNGAFVLADEIALSTSLDTEAGA